MQLLISNTNGLLTFWMTPGLGGAVQGHLLLSFLLWLRLVLQRVLEDQVFTKVGGPTMVQLLFQAEIALGLFFTLL